MTLGKLHADKINPFSHSNQMIENFSNGTKTSSPTLHRSKRSANKHRNAIHVFDYHRILMFFAAGISGIVEEVLL